MPNEELVDFILRCIEIREKLVLTSKTSGENKYDEVLATRLFLRSVERGLGSNSILQEIRLALRSQGLTNEDILSATQRGIADKKDRAKNSSKRYVKVHRLP